MDEMFGSDAVLVKRTIHQRNMGRNTTASTTTLLLGLKVIHK